MGGGGGGSISLYQLCIFVRLKRVCSFRRFGLK